MHKLKLIASIALVLFLVATVAAQAAPQRVIVVFDQVLNEAAQEALLKGMGATVLRDLPIINGKAVMLPQQAEAALERMGGVVRVDPDVIVSALRGKPPKDPKPPPEPEPEPGTQELPWGVDRVDADLVWGTSTGTGVNVGVVDTGIDLGHPDLQVMGDVNIIRPRKSGNDDSGHGTHVAGTIAALDNEIVVIGVAPEANLYAVKVLDRNGSGYLSDVIAGLQWCINNNMDVVNLSLGTASNVQALHDAVIAVDAAGIIQVAAAGNASGGPVIYPAAYEEVMAVSAIGEDDVIAGFSSIGPEVELAAPGVNILSTAKGGGSTTKDGTSMACPHVTGVVALALAAGVTDVRGTMQATADDLGAPGMDDLYGYGLVDAEEVVTGISTMAPPASRFTPTSKVTTVWGGIKNRQ